MKNKLASVPKLSLLLCAALRVAADGCSDVKSCPEPLGGGDGEEEGRRNPVAWSSKFRRSPKEPPPLVL